jgi:hypothetical protein
MTTATRFAVFYATVSKVLRRIVIPDHDSQLAALSVPPGERMMLLPLAQPPDDASWRATIAAAAGVPTSSGRCCIIDGGGDVIGTCNADPALDSHQRGQLVASDHAGPGDRYLDGTFLRRYAVVSSATNTVATTAWLPIPGSPAGCNADMIPRRLENTDATGLARTYLLPSLVLRVGDTIPVRSAEAITS